MSGDMKDQATVTITQDEFEILQEALIQKEVKHSRLAKMTKNSGYGFLKASTAMKMDWHREKAKAALDLVSKISQEFI